MRVRHALAAFAVAALTVPLAAAAAPAQSATGLVYSAHVQNIGWQASVSDGATAGTTGKSLRMEALRIKG